MHSDGCTAAATIVPRRNSGLNLLPAPNAGYVDPAQPSAERNWPWGVDLEEDGLSAVATTRGSGASAVPDRIAYRTPGEAPVYHRRYNGAAMNEAQDARRRRSVFPGFRDISGGRQRIVEELVTARLQLGLSQAEVAAQMGTSQSAVARLEGGEADMRLSTVQRYAATVGREVKLSTEGGTDEK